MKTHDYQTPMCVDFNLDCEGVLCYSFGNENYNGSDYNDEWVNQI